MENTSSLSIESFSRTWLVNFSPTSDAPEQQSPPPPPHSSNTSFDASDEASFIEMDPKLSDSRRFYRVAAKDFSFDFRSIESPVTLKDADELFTDGLLMPFITGNDRLIKTEESETSNYYYNYKLHTEKTESSESPRLILSSISQKEVNSPSRIVACAASLRKCKSVSKRIIHKYFDFITPICEKLRRRRRSASRVASMNTQFDPCSPAAATFPGQISAKKNEQFLGGDSECSIRDAVLHCKRTNVEL